MEQEQIIKTETETGGVFQYLAGAALAGEMTFTRNGKNGIIIDHTEVNEAFNGKGIGKALVLFAVEDARKNGYTILPLCPFAKSVFDRNVQLHDVLFQFKPL